jgi:RNA polymerase sigma factor (sigma-70 family)
MPESKRVNLPRIKDRDEEALRGLFDFLLPPLSRQVCLYARELPLIDLNVDNLVHDALLKIYVHLDKAPLDDESRFLAWCNVITKNVLLDSARTLRRRDLECYYYDEAAAEILEPEAPEIPEPAAVRLLENLLNNLSQEDRDLILLRSAGKTLAEIAEARGVAAGQARQIPQTPH